MNTENIRLRSELNFYESRLFELNQKVCELQSNKSEINNEEIIKELLMKIEIVKQKIVTINLKLQKNMKYDNEVQIAKAYRRR